VDYTVLKGASKARTGLSAFVGDRKLATFLFSLSFGSLFSCEKFIIESFINILLRGVGANISFEAPEGDSSCLYDVFTDSKLSFLSLVKAYAPLCVFVSFR